MKFVTESAEETRAWGEKLGRILRAGEVVALYGELGSGKTCFIQGIARGLGIEGERVVSPSFVLIREYRGSTPFCHIDLYRLSSGKEVEALGLEEYLGKERVCAIEWAEKAEELLPPGTIKIDLDFVDETRRRIVIRGLDDERRKRISKPEIRISKSETNSKFK